jgi:hypothetical protein
MFTIGVLLLGMSLGGMFGHTQASSEAKAESNNESFMWIMSSNSRGRRFEYDWE